VHSPIAHLSEKGLTGIAPKDTTSTLSENDQLLSGRLSAVLTHSKQIIGLTINEEIVIG
jgi:hypothetical protein